MGTKFHRVGAAVIAGAVLGVAAPALGAGADEATGVALFDQAKTAMKAGDYRSACPKIAEAQRLHPTPAKLLALGDCYERTGALASSWGSFRQAAIAAKNAGDADRQTEGERRAAALEGKLSKLTIVLSGVPGAGLEVRRDGGLVGEGQLGTAVPVDPGEHVIEVSAPRKRRFTAKVQVAPGGVNVAVNVPELPSAPEDGAGAGAGAGEGGGFVWTPRRIAGLAVGGVGVVGIVVGSVFGVKTIGKTNDAKAHCSTSSPPQCDPMGITLEHDAKTTANVSNVAFALGGAAAVAGAVMIAVPVSATPKKDANKRVEILPAVAGGTAGLVLRGAW